MKHIISILAFSFITIFTFAQTSRNTQQPPIQAHGKVVHPTLIKTPEFFGISTPLRDAPIATPQQSQSQEFEYNNHEDRTINPNISPPDFNQMPADSNEQTYQGWIKNDSRALTNNYAGQNSPYYPPDCNGSVNSSYYFQVVNTTYQIFNKSDGSSAAGPSDLNTIFDQTLPGATRNDGDPIVLWDEQADRWLYAEFSVPSLSGGGNDYMLIAVSTTNDPTGTWYSWAFDVDDPPDYMKFGIWQDGYYMATNTSGGNDVYVFERSVMVAGGANPQMIAFHNPDRPSTFDGFHCILPLDNDGPWAPAGTPGQFITIADDGQSNPADELRIYELNADWTTPANSTFSMTQQLPVNAFSGNFNSSWDNILQPGTSQKLDGLSTILMYRAQYRNFNGTQKIVCTHTIAEASDESAIRWYELENTGSGWSIAQQGTYNPDNVSRWNGSIAMNDLGEIAIGYSVSDGTSTYPGIRYCGQSTNAPANVMDIAETTIQTGTDAQTGANRWGDYSNISVDPSDGVTFWYTSEYINGSSRATRIASFSFPPSCSAPSTQASNFSAGSATTSALTLSWNRGDGDSVLVVARESSAVNANPVSGMAYFSDTVFGSGSEIGTGNFVIYNGVGTTVTVSELNQGTTYYFSIYEYFGADHCYNTTALTGSGTTQGPPTVSTLAATNITSTTAESGGEVILENGASVTARGVCWSISANPTLSDNHTTDGNGVGTFVSNLSNLSASTHYYIRAYATNTYGTAYGNQEEFVTSCGMVNVFPYQEDFDSWAVSSPDYSCTADNSVPLDDCWINYVGDNIDWDILTGSTGSSGTGPSGDHTSGNGNYIYTEASSCNASTGYVISPDFDFSGLSNPEFSFWYNMYGSNMGSLSVQVSDDGGTTWSGDLFSISGDQGTAWHQESLSLHSYAGLTGVTIRFKGVTGSDYTSDMAIDDVEIFEGCTPPDTQATNMGFQNITDSTLQLTWNRGNGTSVLVLARENNQVNDNPRSGTIYAADTIFGKGDVIGTDNYVVYTGTDTSVNITGLASGTPYYFNVYEYFIADNCYLVPGLSGNTITTGNPPCIACSSYGNTTFLTSTTFVGFNTISNASGKPSGYSDYTDQSTDVKLGNSYSLTVRVNTDGDYTTYTKVWIDWNHDCDFDDAGEEYDLGSATNVSDGLTANSPLSITIPDDTLSGSVTMRVSTKYSSAATSCATDFDGEVEDYSLRLVPGETGWLGNSTDWFDTGNWSNGKVPTSNYIVSVPQTPSGGNFPEISLGNHAVCYKLIVEPNATIIVNGTLEVKH